MAFRMIAKFSSAQQIILIIIYFFESTIALIRYQLGSICDCAEACARALLNDCTNSKTSEESDVCRLSKVELSREPNQSACETLLQVSNLAGKLSV